MNRGQLPATRCQPPTGNGPERMSGRNTICRNTPSHIMSPTTGSQPESSTEVSLGVRGHTPPLQRAHAPPTTERLTQPNKHQRLTTPNGTSKWVPTRPCRGTCSSPNLRTSGPRRPAAQACCRTPPLLVQGCSETASLSWAWAASQVTRSPLRRTAQGEDEGVDRSVDGWVDLESTLEPPNRPAAPGVSTRCLIDGVRRGWSRPEGSELVHVSEGCSRGPRR
jgi:hypothetical protein